MRILAAAVAAIAVLLVLVLIGAASRPAPRPVQQPAQQPALPASITVDGRTYPCGPVRQAWDSGNMDQWDSYPSDAGFRCITG
jgi:hypothetical protein